MKISFIPIQFKLKIPFPGSKSTTRLKKLPVIYTLPNASRVNLADCSYASLPIRLAQIKLPAGSSLVIKISYSGLKGGGVGIELVKA